MTERTQKIWEAIAPCLEPLKTQPEKLIHIEVIEAFLNDFRVTGESELLERAAYHLRELNNPEALARFSSFLEKGDGVINIAPSWAAEFQE